MEKEAQMTDDLSSILLKHRKESSPPPLPSFGESKEKELNPFSKQEVKKLPQIKVPETPSQIIDHETLPQKKNIFMLWLLSAITLGIYTAIWYIKRSRELNNLGVPKKLAKRIPKTLLIINIITIAAIILFPLTISPEEMGSFYQNSTAMQTMLIIILGAGIILRVIFSLYLAFKSRSIINQALDNKGEKPISGFFTFIFTHLYIQYEINRIDKDEEDKPRKGPWVWFIIILLITIGYIVLGLI